MFGGEIANGRGHIMGFAGYQNTNEVLQGDRDYSQCALGTRNGGSEFTCSGSSTNEFTNLLNLDGGYVFPNGNGTALGDTGVLGAAGGVAAAAAAGGSSAARA